DGYGNIGRVPGRCIGGWLRSLRYRRRVSSGESSAVVDTGAPAPRSLAGRVRAAVRQSAAFLVVGVIGFLVDAGTYNLLVFNFGAWGGEGVMFDIPLPAKIIAIAVAT